jgi:SAM-dependent methyltransferase
LCFGELALGNVFEEIGAYWAEIAQKHYTQNQVEFLKKTLKKTSLTLDLACGTARHLNDLSRSGFDVVGLDISQSLLKIAKEQNPNAQLVRGDMRSLPFKARCFGAVVCMDASLGYLPNVQGDLEVFGEVKRILVGGGRFVVDVFNKELILSKYQNSDTKEEWLEYPSFLLLQKRTVTKDGAKMRDFWVTKNYSDGKLHRFVHCVRLYDCQALQSLLVEAGFCVEEVLGDYDFGVFGMDSKRLIVFAVSNR